jgi:aminocarboxymuconate-semialdehyde decarboxylase
MEAARLINGIYADVVRQGRGRFAAFAALPLPHIAAAIQELRRALDDLEMAGVAATTEVMGKSLADLRSSSEVTGALTSG